MIMTAQQTADYLQITYVYLAILRSRAEGPAYFKLGKSVRYRKEDVDDWCDKRVIKAA